jgi:hypothetical protein
VLAAEHLLDLAGLHLLVERVERLRELRVDGFARLRPLDQDAEVVALLLQRLNEIAILFETPAALQDFLRRGRVVPEVRRCGFRFELIQFLVGTSGFKDNSADQTLFWSDPGNGASARQLSAWVGLYQSSVVSLQSSVRSAMPSGGGQA